MSANSEKREPCVGDVVKDLCGIWPIGYVIRDRGDNDHFRSSERFQCQFIGHISGVSAVFGRGIDELRVIAATEADRALLLMGRPDLVDLSKYHS